MQPETQTGTINPVFAGYAAQQLQEATGGIDRVFDNLRKIAQGRRHPTPTDTTASGPPGSSTIEAFGKVTKNQARIAAEPRPDGESDSGASPEGKGACPERSAAESKGPVVRLEQKLDDTLGPPQAPAGPDQTVEAGSKPASPEPPERGLPAPSPNAPGYFPDLVRESQYYIMEITNYGDDLASILMSIHEPDPEDDSIRDCQR